jgi:hypothetical protein
MVVDKNEEVTLWENIAKATMPLTSEDEHKKLIKKYKKGWKNKDDETMIELDVEVGRATIALRKEERKEGTSSWTIKDMQKRYVVK